MIQTSATAVMLFAILWPLFLAGAIAFSATRPAALRLAPWGTLPALAAVAAPAGTGIRLPGVLMGSGLVLDDIAITFLLLNASVWLATGLLARPMLKECDGNRFAMLLLLAASGGIVMSVAQDVLLFFAASTIAGYAFYGLLIHQADKQVLGAGRVLIVLLVLSDVVLFELLLVLSQLSGGIDFPTVRQGFATAHSGGLMFLLLTAGFGIKAGLAGLHYWLAPVIACSQRVVRPALIGVMFSGGLLGWLRLMPIGDAQWSVPGAALQWLAWFTLAYAVIAGLLQAHRRSVVAYAIMALTGLWLFVLSFGLLRPQLWHAVIEAVRATILTAGLAFAALLLLDRRVAAGIPALPGRVVRVMSWLAALIVAVPAASMANLVAQFDRTVAMQVSWATAAVAFLAVLSLVLAEPDGDGADASLDPAHSGRRATEASAALCLIVAAGLMTAATAVAAYTLGTSPPAAAWRAILPVIVATLAAWASAAGLTSRLPTLSPGDILVPLRKSVAAALGHGSRLASARLPVWRDGCSAYARQLLSRANLWVGLGRLESSLGRWRNVLLILLLVAIVTASLGQF